MAKYQGTKADDTVVGAAEANSFFDFGLGHDVLTGSGKNDVFYLTVDEITDIVDGRDGNDTIDYSGSKYAVGIDLLNGSVTATFHHQYPISYDATVTVTQVQNIEMPPARPMATRSTGPTATMRLTAMAATIGSTAATATTHCLAAPAQITSMAATRTTR